jgi:signal transduction histidine kinase
LIWTFLALPAFDSSTRQGETFSPAQWASWLVLFFAFGLAFLVSSSPKAVPPVVRILALLAQTGCVVGMTAIFQGYLVGFLLVVVSWQVALVLPVWPAILWAAADSALWAFFQEPHFHMGWRWSATGAFLGFQVFALVTAAIARAEAEMREEQRRVNAELISTRELLRESSKAGERMRISRELHDLLGHHLTALCLHLEAALHSPEAQARTTIEKALATARQALHDVRSVVSSLHGSEEIDLRRALESLAENVPRIALHLSLPGELHLTDGNRAQAVLRCVQEITTNTLKHSDAQNLWITLRLEQGAIAIEARDDGHLTAAGPSGTGIRSMRQRLEELGGGVMLDTESPRGFRLRAWVPVAGPAEVQVQ